MDTKTYIIIKRTIKGTTFSSISIGYGVGINRRPLGCTTQRQINQRLAEINRRNDINVELNESGHNLPISEVKLMQFTNDEDAHAIVGLINS